MPWSCLIRCHWLRSRFFLPNWMFPRLKLLFVWSAHRCESRWLAGKMQSISWNFHFCRWKTWNNQKKIWISKSRYQTPMTQIPHGCQSLFSRVEISNERNVARWFQQGLVELGCDIQNSGKIPSAWNTDSPRHWKELNNAKSSSSELLQKCPDRYGLRKNFAVASEWEGN